MRINMHDLLEQRAHSHANDPALTYKNTTVTYAELWRQACAVAAGLREMGLERGERVGVFLDKRIETVAAVFGISAAGGVFVPINPVLRSLQVGHILRDCGMAVLITSPERMSMLETILEGCPSLRDAVLVTSDAAKRTPDQTVPNYTVRGWTEVFGTMRSVAPKRVSVDIDMAAIFYTSGSTGKPKGVVVSHRNLIVGAESVSDYLRNTADDVVLAALPLSFDAGFSQLTTAFSVGAHVVLMNYLVPADVVRLCARHRITGLTCVPPLWIQIADLEWPATASGALRYFANTGGRMPKSILEKLRQHFPEAEPFLMYGLTEAFRSTYLDPAEIDRRPSSIGKAIPNAEILVVRPDGTPCSPGEEGELVHRGALVAMGYWGDAARTAERFRSSPGPDTPWRTPETAVWSGDAVVADEEGFLYFVGRKDEMIKTSGYRVSPTEIEEVAYASGMVRDAVALGVDDPRLGQRVLLVVTSVAEAGLETTALIAAMKRQLPLYMVPSSVVELQELPRSPNGKFDRALLRRELTT